MYRIVGQVNLTHRASGLSARGGIANKKKESERAAAVALLKQLAERDGDSASIASYSPRSSAGSIASPRGSGESVDLLTAAAAIEDAIAELDMRAKMMGEGSYRQAYKVECFRIEDRHWE